MKIKISLILFLAICTQLQAKISEQDSLTLVKFQDAVMAKGWPMYWDTTKPVSSWTWVTTESKTGRVTGLKFYGDDFPSGQFNTDSIPHCINILLELDSLKKMAIAGMDIKHISDELWKFTNLESLALNNNKIEGIHPDINNLTKLKLLFLGNNSFERLPSISNLTKLWYLDLSQLKNMENIPASVFTLTNLEVLDVGWGGLKSLPPEIENLKKLKELRIGSSKLKTIPKELGNCLEIEELYVSFNELSELPETIGNLKKLRTIEFGGNNIKKLPSSFKRLSNLVSVSCIRNEFEVFPQELVGLPNLIQIKADYNKIKTLPDDLLAMYNLKLTVSHNLLSGSLKISRTSVPRLLDISNNFYTFKNILPFYSYFNGVNNYLIVESQGKIGTEKTFYPDSDKPFTLSIENYTPASGCTFQWYRRATLNDLWYKFSTDQEIKWDDTPLSGFYFCVVSHPAIPKLSLSSFINRVIVEDKAPKVIVKRAVFRQGETGQVFINITDDFTSEEDLIITWPSETDHFILKEFYSTRKVVVAKDPNWTGTDKIKVKVEDENGNISFGTGNITQLPVKNEPPVVEIPNIYLSIYDDMEMPCTPGTPGCPYFYPFESSTRLDYFISDDFDTANNLSVKILEANEYYELNDNPNLFVSVIPGYTGPEMQASINAYSDTVVTATLEVKDREGGVTTQKINLICNGTKPNKNPELKPIEDQIIIKGEKGFNTIDLKEYASDDYVLMTNLTFDEMHCPLISMTLENGVVQVKPQYLDSVFTTEVTYFVEEKTNDFRRNSIDVVYKVIDGYKISGKVTDESGNPLSGIGISAGDKKVYSNNAGVYEVFLKKGWSGEIVPQKNFLDITPNTLRVSSLEKDINQNFTVNTSTSVPTVSSNDIIIYPIPTSNKLNIDGLNEIAGYSIISSDGQVVQTGTLKNSIELRSLPQGIYLLQVKGERCQFTKKFIIR